MGAVDYLVVLIIVAIVGGAAFYIYKAKKLGQKCIGCPQSGSCQGSCGGHCSSCNGSCDGSVNKDTK